MTTKQRRICRLAASLALLSACAPTPHSPPDPAGYENRKIDPRIWAIHQARNGDYWFGSNGNGVYRYDRKRVVHYSAAHGLVGDQVRDIQEDAAGNILVATTKAVCRFDGVRFERLPIVEPTDASSGWRLDADDLWIQFDPGPYGTLRYDGSNLYHLKLPKSPVEDTMRARLADAPGFFTPTSVYHVSRDRRGHVWFGTAAVGLCRYDGETFGWMYEEHLTTTPSGGAFGIRCIHEDRDGAFWICNTRHRFRIAPQVAVRDGFRHLGYEREPGLPEAGQDTAKNFDFYARVAEDERGAMWMACGSDVLKYDGDDVTRYAIVDGAYATAILLDQQGKVWVGTVEHGIYTFDGESFRRFSVR